MLGCKEGVLVSGPPEDPLGRDVALGTGCSGDGEALVPLPDIDKEALQGGQSLVREWISPSLWRSPFAALRISLELRVRLQGLCWGPGCESLGDS